jgi:hypothetical protein
LLALAQVEAIRGRVLFDDHDRAAYVLGLHSALRPGGRYFMLGFSDQQQGQWGPVRKLAQDNIRAAFAAGWQIDSIKASTIEITTDPAGIRARLAALIRTGEERNADR